MSVEFNDENNLGPKPQFESVNEPSKMAVLIMKFGLADSEEKANKVLTGIAITAFILTLFVIFKFVI